MSLIYHGCDTIPDSLQTPMPSLISILMSIPCCFLLFPCVPFNPFLFVAQLHSDFLIFIPLFPFLLGTAFTPKTPIGLSYLDLTFVSSFVAFVLCPSHLFDIYFKSSLSVPCHMPFSELLLFLCFGPIA